MIDIDIEELFDNIEHGIIMAFIRAEIADGNVLNIIKSFLKSGVKKDGKIIPTTKGLPRGSFISPLLANITLNYLDWQLESAGYKFVHYTNDIIIMCKTSSETEDSLKFTLAILKDLKIVNNTKKKKIAKVEESFKFIGFNIRKHKVFTKITKKKSKKKIENSL